MTPVLARRSRIQWLLSPSNGYHDTSSETLWQRHANGPVKWICASKLETFSPYHRSYTRRDSYSAYAGWERAAGPQYSDTKIGLMHLAVWMNTPSGKGSCSCFPTSREEPKELQKHHVSEGEESKRKFHFLMQKKFRSLWSSALDAYKTRSSYDCR